MALVHSLGRMHRDLKSGNILATAHRGTIVLKVADFGTATLAAMALQSGPQTETSVLGGEEPGDGRAMAQQTKGIGTPLWMAPEIMAGLRYGPSADVYSYAIVLWEIASQEEPWPDVRGPFISNTLHKLISRGERPPVSSDWPAAYVDMLSQCWQTDPTFRPTFAHILQQLQPPG
jgi:LRR receptor-like serine/threonine-protein kinase FLS2